jgi:hypothetical protein
MRLYLNSGATRGNPPAELPINAEYYKLAKPLLQKLAAMGHPHTAHSVIETLVHFAPGDSRGMLLPIAEVVRAGSSHGYHYEQLGDFGILEWTPILRHFRVAHFAAKGVADGKEASRKVSAGIPSDGGGSSSQMR